MTTTFHPYRPSAWSRLRRYFVEWRQRALMRRELMMLSDRQWEDIGFGSAYRDDARKSVVRMAMGKFESQQD